MRALAAGDRHAAHRSHHGGEISRLVAARGEDDEIIWAETKAGSESDCATQGGRVRREREIELHGIFFRGTGPVLLHYFSDIFQ